MDRRIRLAADSRDGLLALRRVERQQRIIERLWAAHGVAVALTLAELAAPFGVSERTIARDVERLRLSGVPLIVRQGRSGGVRLECAPPLSLIAFDLPEIAALLSSLAVLGPTVSDSATSAMRKLTQSLLHQPASTHSSG